MGSAPVTALIAAILAHYVEIHFGIAIASSRTHFFLYLASLFVLTYLMPRQAEAPVPVEVKKGKGRGRKRTLAPSSVSSYGTWGPVLLNALMLALIMGTMGYTYITYNQPPDVRSVEQITPSAIFTQSMLINSKQEFSDSPFLFLQYILTWVLGVLLIVSEMTKDRELRFNLSGATLAANKQRVAAIIFLVMGLGSFLWRFLFPLPDSAGATSLLGQSLFWIWGALCLTAAILLFFRQAQSSRLLAGAVALGGLLFALPLLLAGGVAPGLLLSVICAVVLYLVWDSSWNGSLGAAGLLAAVSLSVGLAYTYFHAVRLRQTILYSVFNPPPEAQELLGDFLIGEAEQAANLLVVYYIFVVLIMIAAAFSMSLSRKPALRENGTMVAYAALAVMVVLVAVTVYFTNTQVIQADIIYKRGKVYDTEASRSQNPTNWENAIAIYNAALDRASREDFYYLFLGRAFLELATLMTNSDRVEASLLLNEASDRLQDAQDINPLNTDHTANLARLNTRWVNLSDGEFERGERLATAEDYYLDALELSPQNSIIRNEYGALVVSVLRDCERGLDIYRESLEIDPYYADTYFRIADALVTCGNEESDERRDEMYLESTEYLEEGLARQAGNARAWLRLAQIYQTIERYDESIAAFEQLRVADERGRVAPAWNIDFTIAQLYEQLGDVDSAIDYAQRALTAVPEENAGQVRRYLNQLEGGPDTESDTAPALELAPVADFELDGPRPLAELPPAQRQDFYAEYPDTVIDTSAAYEAVIETEKGPMRFRLFAEASPLTVNSFVFLAAQGFYDGVSFHRVLEDFMAQTGDPTGTGSGGPGYNFADEVNNGLSFDRPGLLAMANAGPNTNGSQFFITTVPTPHLDGGHTIFGELLEGEEVLNNIALRDPQRNPDTPGDLIERIEIIIAEES